MDIKFKAWDKVNERFLTNWRWKGESGCIGCVIDLDDPEKRPRSPKEFELLSYTGKKDKGGKDISEGDIVKWETQELDLDFGPLEYIPITKISKIVWSDRGFWVEGESFGWEGESLWDWDEIEVIGNIYQNPELLEEK